MHPRYKTTKYNFLSARNLFKYNLTISIFYRQSGNLNCSCVSHFHFQILELDIFIEPRCPWSDLWVLVFLTHTPFADLTDVTLADEDTNSILIDNANRAIQGNVAMQVAPSGGKSCN